MTESSNKAGEAGFRCAFGAFRCLQLKAESSKARAPRCTF